jgi:hypothetical protein
MRIRDVLPMKSATLKKFIRRILRVVQIVWAMVLVVGGFYFVLLAREIWRTAEYTNEIWTAISSAVLGFAVLIFGFKLAARWWDRQRS